VAFNPGEFIAEPGREGGALVQFVDIEPLAGEPGKYLIRYDVFRTPDSEAETPQGEYIWDSNPPPDEKIEGLITVTGGGAAGEGTTPEEAVGGATAQAPGATEVGLTAGATPREVTVADLEPVIERTSPNLVEIRFDNNSFDYFRNADADSVASTVKTQVAKDPQTGETLGLRITGFSGDSPADRFDVRPGDILVSIDGQAVQSRSDAINIAQGIDPDTTRVPVVIDRNGRRITYNIDPTDPRTQRQGRHLGTASGESLVGN
jgi:hypothetical protein